MIKLRKTRRKQLIMLLKKMMRKPILKLRLMNKPTRKLKCGGPNIEKSIYQVDKLTKADMPPTLKS